MKKRYWFMLIAAGVFMLFYLKSNDVNAPRSKILEEVDSKKEMTVLAVGDIMLGRFVEELSLRHGFNYPLVFSQEIFSQSDIVFGNFEGAIPSEHQKTPNYNYKLSIPKESVNAIFDAGISVVSLANNHSSDFGEDEYAHTVSVLNNAGIATFGKNSDYGYKKNDMKIRFMGWNDTSSHLPVSVFLQDIRSSKKEDEFLIAAVHFGEEYATTSSDRQKEIAHALIDAGADVVIGTHPHVVEEVELYHGSPIFYSLGNFIFDQYFSEETQNGLAVKMRIKKDFVEYELLPIDLHQSQPRLMENREHRKFIVLRK